MIVGERPAGFVYARNGEPLTSFEPLFASRRRGTQPDVLLAQMIAVGIDDSLGEERYGRLHTRSLALAERACPAG